LQVKTPAFHPDLRRIARVLPRGVVGPRRLPVMRALQRLARPNLARHGIEVVQLGPISLRLHRPPTAPTIPAPAVLWIHGGGYVMGHAAQEDLMCGRMAAELGAVVASVDYRLAPEHPFPEPLHDCHDALVWLARRDDVDVHRIVIGGASAGGGLAAALALLARDRDEVRPLFQLLTYPMLDDRTAVGSSDPRGVRLWNTSSNRFGWRSYLGADPGGDDVSGLAAPGRAVNLEGVAPAWIGVGDLDLFFAEDLAYADRLRAAGVQCEVFRVEGAFHGFDVIHPRATVSRAFRNAQMDAASRALAGPQPPRLRLP
jgi:acetyl esterase/lipase